MAHHYTRYLEILKKWPVEELRTTFCFGKYLRDSSSQWFTPDGRVIGSPEVCEHRLQSLERLIADTYRQRYPAHVKSVTEMKVEDCRNALLEDFDNKPGILKGAISKIWPGASKK